MNGRIFQVSIMVTTVIQADNSRHAVQMAKECFCEIAGDALARDIAVGVLAEITAIAGLPDGWDRRCLPYGGDGIEILDKLLPERAPSSMPTLGDALPDTKGGSCD
jgi:hypothetical protein